MGRTGSRNGVSTKKASERERQETSFPGAERLRSQMRSARREFYSTQATYRALQKYLKEKDGISKEIQDLMKTIGKAQSRLEKLRKHVCAMEELLGKK